MKKIALCCLLFTALNDSWACRVAPRDQLIGVDQQIQFAADVALAKVIHATRTDNGAIEYEFEVQRRLKGMQREFFTVTGEATVNPGQDRSYREHEDPAFWQNGGGRLFNSTDCVIHPTFIVGHSYLAFLGQTTTRRSFEHIETDNDKWLQYVERELGKANQL